MTTEVAQCLPYNCSADTFSFGILLWEIMALKPAFGGGLTRKQYYERVSLGGERPPVSTKWPPLTQQVMKECWGSVPKDRPKLKRVGELIRADLEDMTHDEHVINRTNHMRRRSVHSRHGGVSIRRSSEFSVRSKGSNLEGTAQTSTIEMEG